LSTQAADMIERVSLMQLMWTQTVQKNFLGYWLCDSDVAFSVLKTYCPLCCSVSWSQSAQWRSLRAATKKHMWQRLHVLSLACWRPRQRRMQLYVPLWFMTHKIHASSCIFLLLLFCIFCDAVCVVTVREFCL